MSFDMGEPQKTASSPATAGDQSAQALAFSLASLQRLTTTTKVGSEKIRSKDGSMSIPKERIERCRERNREHARRTRIRKKVQIEALQVKCKNLQDEQVKLKQVLEDRRVASILLNLSGNAPAQKELPPVDNDKSSLNESSDTVDTSVSSSKKKRKTPPSTTLSILIDGVQTVFSSKAQVNWKTGVYTDSGGKLKRLSTQQLDSLRRERNRLHAKMTRERKKCFLFNIQKEIDDLENENERLRRLIKPTIISPELSSTHPESTTSATPHHFVLDT